LQTVCYSIVLKFDPLLLSPSLGEYKSAISDFTTAIKLDPDGADAYYNRGVVKANAGLSYCSDFKKACELGIKEVCEVYNDQCR